MAKKEKLSGVDRPDRFVVKSARKYFWRGRIVDLHTINTATAEALANDPACMFVQWADANARPKHQRAPLPAAQKQAVPPTPPKKA